MIFDTHAHYDDEQFDTDRDQLLDSLEDRGIGRVVNVSAAYPSWEACIRLAEKYPFVYAAAGIHPDHSGELDKQRFEELRRSLEHPKVVAVGEIGLDYYWDETPRDIQKKWFVRQLDLAREADLPVIIHSRDAAADTLKIMKESAADLRGVIHCFSYSKETALEYIDMGYYIGVGGVVTFKNGRKLKETVQAIPLSSIVLETDCPYLAPVPNRGRRNSSENLVYVAEEIARLKEVSYEEVVEQTRKNAEELYRLPPIH